MVKQIDMSFTTQARFLRNLPALSQEVMLHPSDHNASSLERCNIRYQDLELIEGILQPIAGQNTVKLPHAVAQLMIPDWGGKRLQGDSVHSEEINSLDGPTASMGWVQGGPLLPFSENVMFSNSFADVTRCLLSRN